jgi:ribosomal-protein-alanine N-acetyltransferase
MILETPRLLLRRFGKDVLDHVSARYSDQELMDFYGLITEERLSYHRSWAVNGCTTFNKDILFFHLLNKDDISCIGWCGYHTWYTDHDRAELGYVLNRGSDMGKGLMSEALATVLEYGFTAMKLHRIEAMAAPYNKGSIRLLEKNGFRLEGVLREHYQVNGKNEDSNIYSLLRREYENAAQ